MASNEQEIVDTGEPMLLVDIDGVYRNLYHYSKTVIKTSVENRVNNLKVWR